MMNNLPISNIYQTSLTCFLKQRLIINNHTKNGLLVLILILTRKQFKKYFHINYDDTKVVNDFESYRNHITQNCSIKTNNPFLQLHNDLRKFVITNFPIIIIPYYLSIEKIDKISLLNYRN